MKSITRVQKKIEPEVGPSIPVRCPYCGVSTVVNILMTEPKCKHFDDFTLFKQVNDSLHEIDGTTEPVVLCEAIFRLSGSRYPNIEVRKYGELDLTDEGIKIMVNGKLEGYMSQNEFSDMIMDDDEGADYVRDE